jgi:hypothetical protein
MSLGLQLHSLGFRCSISYNYLVFKAACVWVFSASTGDEGRARVNHYGDGGCAHRTEEIGVLC